MSNKKNLEQNIENCLNSLDGMQKATASPYLFTRLQQSLQEDKSWWSIFAGTLSRPVIAISLSLFILFINIWLIFSSSDTNAESGTDNLSDLAITYHFESNNPAEQNSTLP